MDIIDSDFNFISIKEEIPDFLDDIYRFAADTKSATTIVDDLFASENQFSRTMERDEFLLSDDDYPFLTSKIDNDTIVRSTASSINAPVVIQSSSKTNETFFEQFEDNLFDVVSSAVVSSSEDNRKLIIGDGRNENFLRDDDTFATFGNISLEDVGLDAIVDAFPVGPLSPVVDRCLKDDSSSSSSSNRSNPFFVDFNLDYLLDQSLLQPLNDKLSINTTTADNKPTDNTVVVNSNDDNLMSSASNGKSVDDIISTFELKKTTIADKETINKVLADDRITTVKRVVKLSSSTCDEREERLAVKRKCNAADNDGPSKNGLKISIQKRTVSDGKTLLIPKIVNRKSDQLKQLTPIVDTSPPPQYLHSAEELMEEIVAPETPQSLMESDDDFGFNFNNALNNDVIGNNFNTVPTETNVTNNDDNRDNDDGICHLQRVRYHQNWTYVQVRQNNYNKYPLMRKYCGFDDDMFETESYKCLPPAEVTGQVQPTTNTTTISVNTNAQLIRLKVDDNLVKDVRIDDKNIKNSITKSRSVNSKDDDTAVVTKVYDFEDDEKNNDNSSGTDRLFERKSRLNGQQQRRITTSLAAAIGSKKRNRRLMTVDLKKKLCSPSSDRDNNCQRDVVIVGPPLDHDYGLTYAPSTTSPFYRKNRSINVDCLGIQTPSASEPPTDESEEDIEEEDEDSDSSSDGCYNAMMIRQYNNGRIIDHNDRTNTLKRRYTVSVNNKGRNKTIKKTINARSVRKSRVVKNYDDLDSSSPEPPIDVNSNGRKNYRVGGARKSKNLFCSASTDNDNGKSNSNNNNNSIRGYYRGSKSFTPEIRRMHNTSEQVRRVEMKNLFENLRCCVPSICGQSKTPKVQILIQASAHCENLCYMENKLAIRKMDAIKRREVLTNLHSELTKQIETLKQQQQ